MLDSATAGQPGSPSRPEISPSWQQASAPGEPRILGVLGHDAVERPDVLQGPAHQSRVGDAVAVVGEHPDLGSGAGHQPQLGELRPGKPLAHRTDRDHLGRAGRPAQRGQMRGGLGGVGDRVGVGHGQHRGVPAARRRPRTRGDGLGVLAPGLPQVGVQIDQAGQRHQPVGVQPFRRLARRRPGR